MTIGTVDRQWPLVAVARFGFDDVSSEAAVEVLEIPGNAVVTGGQVLVVTAFDDSGTASLAVGDADDPNRFGDINVKALGSAELTIGTANRQYSVPTQLTVTFSGQNNDGTEGVGEVLLLVEYVIENRCNETQ